MNDGGTELQNDYPLVSVVIPAFNAGATLDETLRSLRQQTYPNLEVVVVNDGSTDTTAEVLRTHGAWVRTIEQQNAGLPAARNTGCAAAKGEFIALMDADDLCEPQRIACQVRALQHYPLAALCSSDFSAFDQNGLVADSYGSTYYSKIAESVSGLRSLYPTQAQIPNSAAPAHPAGPLAAPLDAYVGNIYAELVHGNFVHPPTVMFRRKLLDVAGWFDATLRQTCDWEWIVRASRTGEVVHLAHPLLRYRISPAQMSSRNRALATNALEILRTFDKIVERDPNLMSTHARSLRTCQGTTCLDAAYIFADTDKIRAGAFWVRGTYLRRGLDAYAVKVLLRTLFPRWAVAFARRVRT